MNTTTNTNTNISRGISVVDELRRLLDTAKADERRARDALTAAAHQVEHLKSAVIQVEKAFGLGSSNHRVVSADGTNLPGRLVEVLSSDSDCEWTAELVFTRYCKARAGKSESRSRVISTLDRLVARGVLVKNGDFYSLPDVK